MGVYDLEEQEKLDDLKAWWQRYGGTVTLAVVAACAVVIGVQGWRWWTHAQAEKASVLYTAVSTAARTNDLAKAKDAASQLTESYSGSAYAPAAALLVAKMLWDSGDKAAAKVQLQWVIDRSDEEELKQVARYRLAEAQLDAKAYDDALRTLDAKHDDSFAGLYADLRGDVLAAAGRTADARAAYQTAIAKLDPKSPYRNYVQVKFDAFGGVDAATVAGGAQPAAAPPAPAAAPSAAPAAPAKK